MSQAEDSAGRIASKAVVAVDKTDRPGHANIYAQLVLNENDLVGLVAYGLYKRRKRAWIEAYQEKNEKHPTPQECDGFSFGYRKDALAALRVEAEGAMATFAEQVVENNVEVMRRDALDSKMQSILGEINSKLLSLEGYRHHIVGHLVGFVILVGIVAFGTFIVRFEPSIEGAYNWLFRTSSHGTTVPAPASDAIRPASKSN